MSKRPTLAILGGTGKEGRGLAYRWARAGYPILIGSRSRERAQQTAALLRERVGLQVRIEGMENTEAAREGDIVVLCVPYAGLHGVLHAIRDAVQGKLVVNVIVPLKPPKVTRVHLPEAGSVAQEIQAVLGPDVAVVDAFQNIAHELLWQEGPIDCDVLVTGKGKANRQRVVRLVKDAGMRAWDAGPIENSAVVEGLTSVLIYINKTYGSTHAGIRITGVEDESPA